MQPVVFSEAWFAQHQRVLLALLALPVIGRLLRRVLAIRPHDVGWARPIVALWPHAYVVDNGDGIYQADLRTHPKFAKRLHVVLWPVWCALHAWDQWVANPWVPSWNLGFDTLTMFPAPSGGAAGDGMNGGTIGSWAGNYTNPISGFSDTDTSTAFASIETDAASPNWRIRRSVFTFDTSLLGSAVVSAATFSLWHTTDSGVNLLSVSASYDVYDTTVSNPALLATATATLGTLSMTTGVVTSATAAAGLNSYVPWTLNAYGLSRLQPPSVFALLVREVNMDVANVTPTWSVAFQYSRIFGVFADNAGTANDPKVDVTFVPSSSILGPNSLRPRVFAPGRAR